MGGIRYGAVTIVACLVLFAGGDKAPKKLIGFWEVVKIEAPDGKVTKNIRKFIEFHKDGTLEGGKMGSIPNRSGTWSYNKEVNTVDMQGSKVDRDNGPYEILELDATDMILFKDSSRIYLQKYNK